jgi:hypothetical protein
MRGLAQGEPSSCTTCCLMSCHLVSSHLISSHLISGLAEGAHELHDLANEARQALGLQVCPLPTPQPIPRRPVPHASYHTIPYHTVPLRRLGWSRADLTVVRARSSPTLAPSPPSSSFPPWPSPTPPTPPHHRRAHALSGRQWPRLWRARRSRSWRRSASCTSSRRAPRPSMCAPPPPATSHQPPATSSSQQRQQQQTPPPPPTLGLSSARQKPRRNCSAA